MPAKTRNQCRLERKQQHDSTACDSPCDHGAAGRSTDAAITSIREFLAFKLGGEEYGIDILRVQEIRSYEAPTRMVNAPPSSRA
jgi:hypothetical protein